MKSVGYHYVLCAFAAAALAGCPSSPAEPPAPKAAQERQAIPLPQDFAEEASKSVTAANYKEKLEALSTELGVGKNQQVRVTGDDQ